jgi:hypothetical protein
MMNSELVAEIDTFVADAFELTDVQREAIAETLAVGLPTAASKGNATRETSDQDRQLFTSTCEEELVDLLDENVRVSSTEIGRGSPWRFIEVQRLNGSTRAPQPSAIDARTIIDMADEGAASLITFNVGQRTTLVGQLDQYRYWTKTRARLLASALVSENPDD